MVVQPDEKHGNKTVMCLSTWYDRHRVMLLREKNPNILRSITNLIFVAYCKVEIKLVHYYQLGRFILSRCIYFEISRFSLSFYYVCSVFSPYVS